MEIPDSRSYKILFVDDEAQARKYFEKAYRHDFPLLTAANAEQAERFLEAEGDHIAVIVTDQRMPGEDGISLLRRVRETHPATVRILTTAFSDIDSAIDAVNTGAVFRYVTKPWDIHELRGILLRAMETHHLQRERDTLLHEKLAAVQNLLLMDRLRSFMVLARALRGRVENPMYGLHLFLQLVQHEAMEGADEAPSPEGDVWMQALEQSRLMMDAVDEVTDRLGPTQMKRTPVRSLLASLPGLETGDDWRIDVDDAGFDVLPEVHADSSVIGHVMLALRQVLAGGASAHVRLMVNTSQDVHATPGVSFTLVAHSSAAASDKPRRAAGLHGRLALETKLLIACLGAAHHHGRCTLGPDRASIELPVEPANASLPSLDGDWLEQAVAAALEPAV